MITVQDILEFLEEHFPLDSACDFDNVGLLIGDESAPVTKVVVALDCTQSVVQYAIKAGCELIVTHHPVIFEPLKTVKGDSLVWRLAQSGIAVISMHTNMDIGIDGVNDCLCKALHFTNIHKISAEDGYLLNSACLSPAMVADELARHLKQCLGGAVKYVGCDHPIKKVLICSGSGGKFLYDAARMGYDALITAEVKHHWFLDAERLQIALFDAGHFETEDVVVEPLKMLLNSRFPSLSCLTDHSAVIRYV